MKYISEEMKKEYEERMSYSQECAEKWEKYWAKPFFDLCEQQGTGAAIIVPQGRFETEIPLKHVALIQRSLEEDPEILNKFLALALGKKAPNQPVRTSKSGRRIRRRVHSDETPPTSKQENKSSEADIELLDDLPL